MDWTAHCLCGRRAETWDGLSWLCPTCLAKKHNDERAEKNREFAQKEAERNRDFWEAEGNRQREFEEQQAQIDQDLEQERLDKHQAFLKSQAEEAEEQAEDRFDRQQQALEEHAAELRHSIANDWRLRAESMRQRAEVKLRAGMVDDATLLLKRAFELDNSNYRIFETLFDAHWQAGDHSNWRKTVLSAIQFLPHSEDCADPARYLIVLTHAARDPDLLQKFRQVLQKHTKSLTAGNHYWELLNELVRRKLFPEVSALLKGLAERPGGSPEQTLQLTFQAIKSAEDLREPFTTFAAKISPQLHNIQTIAAIISDVLARGWDSEALVISDSVSNRPGRIDLKLMAVFVRRCVTKAIDTKQVEAALQDSRSSTRSDVSAAFALYFSVVNQYFASYKDPELTRELQRVLLKRYEAWAPEIHREFVNNALAYQPRWKPRSRWPDVCGWLSAASAWAACFLTMPQGALCGLILSVPAFMVARWSVDRGLRDQRIRIAVNKDWSQEKASWAAMFDGRSPVTTEMPRSTFEWARPVVIIAFIGVFAASLSFGVSRVSTDTASFHTMPPVQSAPKQVIRASNARSAQRNPSRPHGPSVAPNLQAQPQGFVAIKPPTHDQVIEAMTSNNPYFYNGHASGAEVLDRMHQLDPYVQHLMDTHQNQYGELNDIRQVSGRIDFIARNFKAQAPDTQTLILSNVGRLYSDLKQTGVEHHQAPQGKFLLDSIDENVQKMHEFHNGGVVSSPPPAPAHSSNEISSNSAFAIGKRVQVMTNLLNVRSTPGGSRVGIQPLRATGTIVGGPVTTEGTTWWQTDYDAGVDGWSMEMYLRPLP